MVFLPPLDVQLHNRIAPASLRPSKSTTAISFVFSAHISTESKPTYIN